MDRDQLNEHLDKNSDVFRNGGVRGAFEAVDRADFLTEDYLPEAYEDYAVPAGHGQNVSKPTVAAFMLELLDAHEGDSVLEVGSGSGWVTALLSHIVGKGGTVHAVEIVPELVERAKENLSKYDYPQATVEHAGTALGSVEHGPYDRILVTADSGEIPQELVAQLKEGGLLVLPVDGSIVKVEKKNGRSVETVFPGVFEFPKLT